LIQVNRFDPLSNVGPLPRDLLVQDPSGFTAVIQGPAEGFGEGKSIPLGAKDSPENDAGTAR